MSQGPREAQATTLLYAVKKDCLTLTLTMNPESQGFGSEWVGAKIRVEASISHFLSNGRLVLSPPPQRPSVH